MDGVAAGMRGVVVAMLPDVLAWSNSSLLIELALSDKLLNHVPAWGGNCLYRARRGRKSSELPCSYSYTVGSTSQPAGLYAEEPLFTSHQNSEQNVEGDGGAVEDCDSCSTSGLV
ncbi:hypothetical protein D1007_33467 [Hordeum vulgare]|nr:hypothetical protein D1007_33467 [Hordeum vulgare]